MRDLFLERWNFNSRSSNCLGTDLDSMTELCRLPLQEIATPAPLESSILSENVVVDVNMQETKAFTVTEVNK